MLAAKAILVAVLALLPRADLGVERIGIESGTVGGLLQDLRQDLHRAGWQGAQIERVPVGEGRVHFYLTGLGRGELARACSWVTSVWGYYRCDPE